MKKYFAILLSVVLMLSLAVPAVAVDKNDSITVNSANVGETYKLYKLFDLSVNSETDPTAYTYTVNRDWVSFFAENDAGAKYVTINEAGAVTAISDAAALAKAAAEWTDKPNATQSIVADKETVVFDGLDNGYWLITSSLGTIAMTETTPDKADVTITEKNPEDTITKEVKEDSTGEYGATNDAQVGDTVEFESTVTLVSGTRNVVVHDKMDDGLTLNQDSITITALTKDTDYTVEFNTTDGCDFEITFTDKYLNALDESIALTITYTAVLNENAVDKGEDGVAIFDQKNKTQVTFGDGSSSMEAETTTTTYKFSVFKHASGSTDNLADAVFQLKKGDTVVKLIKLDDNNYRVANGEETNAVEAFTTVAKGDIVIWGVDADDDYELKETQAPAGYNLLTEEVAVTVDSANGTRIDVENKSGTELPSTGGMGTTIFYIVGGVMVVAAVVLLITKKRMSAEG